MAAFAAAAGALALGVTLAANVVVPFVFGSEFMKSAGVVRIIIWALPPAMAIQPLHTLLQACDLEMVTLRMAPLRAAMNVGFDLAFIFAGLGIQGIALSSVVTSVLFMVSFLWVGFRALRKRELERAAGTCEA